MSTHPSVPTPAEARSRRKAKFSAATATVEELGQRLSVAMFTAATDVPDYTVDDAANGNKIVRNLKIFRSGTFKDSKGEQHTWTPEHLAQMVSNFDMLRASGAFVNVPVREDHGGSISGVVGYFVSLRTDGAFLYADIEFTEPDAWLKFDRGTFRDRSSEIGFYETNAEALFWPVVSGLAFVDVGAVEGLYANSNRDQHFTLLNDQKETSMTDAEKLAQFTAACNYAQALIDLGLTDVVTRSDHEAAVTAATVAAVAAHSKGAPATFKVSGADTSDYAAVQLHILTLETAQAEASTTARKDFVKGLVDKNVLGAPQQADTEAFAVGLTVAQYAAFEKSYEKAVPNALFGSHGNGVTNPTGEPAELDDRIAIAEGVIAMHKRSGMTPEQIAKTESSIRLAAFKAERDGKAA